MLIVQGYFENSTFHTDTKQELPQRKKALVTFPGEQDETGTERIQRQLAAVREFSAGIQNDPQKLTPKYDEAIAEGLRFRGADFT